MCTCVHHSWFHLLFSRQFPLSYTLVPIVRSRIPSISITLSFSALYLINISPYQTFSHVHKNHEKHHWNPKKIWNIKDNWLMGSSPLKNISQVGWWFPIYGKIKVMFQTTNHVFCWMFSVFPTLEDEETGIRHAPRREDRVVLANQGNGRCFEESRRKNPSLLVLWYSIYGMIIYIYIWNNIWYYSTYGMI